MAIIRKCDICGIVIQKEVSLELDSEDQFHNEHKFDVKSIDGEYAVECIFYKKREIGPGHQYCNLDICEDCALRIVDDIVESD